MQDLKKRVALLEAQHSTVAEAISQDMGAALGRIRAALHELLPAEADVIALDSRRKAGTMTDTDHQILDLLPRDALKAAELDADVAVELYAFIYQSI